jgi:hypothetical protein
VFLLNSWLNHFTETTLRWYALSRSYSINLPSSFSTAHPSALEYSSRTPVSVCGTGRFSLALEVFLASMIRSTICAPEGLQYYQISAGSADLPTVPIPTSFNGLFRQTAALSLLCHPIETKAGVGILTDFPSEIAFRLILRSRLTLIRLTLIRNPCSYGEKVSHLLYRYLYLHFRFTPLQHGSRHTFSADVNAPLPHIQLNGRSTISAPRLMPDYFPCPNPRPVSCYALFK